MRYVAIEPPISLRDLDGDYSVRTIVPHGPRSGGVHLSEILQKANRENGRLKQQIVFGRNTFDVINDDDLPLCMCVGMAWEDMLLKIYPWMERIGELSVDGVAMSPDAITRDCHRHALRPDKRVLVLEEVKATWKSSNRPLEELVPYLQQTKAYCYALGTPYCRLHVMYVNGSYFSEGAMSGPKYVQYHIEYDPKWDLEVNWKDIMRAKKRLEL